MEPRNKAALMMGSEKDSQHGLCSDAVQVVNRSPAKPQPKGAPMPRKPWSPPRLGRLGKVREATLLTVGTPSIPPT